MDQVLADPALTARKFRQWKEANMVLLQEMQARDPAQAKPSEASAVCAPTETSL